MEMSNEQQQLSGEDENELLQYAICLVLSNVSIHMHVSELTFKHKHVTDRICTNFFGMTCIVEL